MSARPIDGWVFAHLTATVSSCLDQPYACREVLGCFSDAHFLTQIHTNLCDKLWEPRQSCLPSVGCGRKLRGCVAGCPASLLMKHQLTDSGDCWNIFFLVVLLPTCKNPWATSSYFVQLQNSVSGKSVVTITSGLRLRGRKWYFETPFRALFLRL